MVAVPLLVARMERSVIRWRPCHTLRGRATMVPKAKLTWITLRSIRATSPGPVAPSRPPTGHPSGGGPEIMVVIRVS